MPDTRRSFAYLAKDLASVTALETACKGSEGQMNAILTAIMAGKVPDSAGGPDLLATIAVYELLRMPPPAGSSPGHLEIKTPGPGQTPAQIIQAQVAAGNRHLLDGTALMGPPGQEKQIPVLVFKKRL
jgi:hypothetical protein